MTVGKNPRASFRAWWIKRWDWLKQHRSGVIGGTLAAALIAAAAVVLAIELGWFENPQAASQTVAATTTTTTSTTTTSPKAGASAPSSVRASAVASAPATPAATPAPAILPPRAAATATASGPTASASASVKIGKEKKPKNPETAPASKARKSRQVQSVAQSVAVVSEPAAVEPGATGGFRWIHFGVAPYASLREVAMRSRESGFQALGLSSACVRELMVATQNPGVRVRINVGDHLDAMLSKGGVVHKNVTVAFQSPVHGMEYSAPAEKWEVTCEGKTVAALLPDVCNNWSLVIGLAPVAQVGVLPPARVGTPGPIVTTPGCPKGIVLFANAWTMDSMSEDLRQKVLAQIAAATNRDSMNASNVSAYRANDVSGGNPGQPLSSNVGDELIRVVNVRAPVGITITAQLLDPVSLAVTKDLGEFRLIDGIAKIYLEPDQRKQVVQTIWPAWFNSPTVSGGERRILVLPESWLNKTGGRYCTAQENATYWVRDRPRP